jgi:carbamoyltransferase
MQALMNLKIKFRESFRPFAPACLLEDVGEFFDLDCESPYMLLVAPVRQHRRVAMTPEQEALFGIEKLNVPRSDIPAVTHVDYSARVQTVNANDLPQFYKVIEAFKRRTGYGIVVNTSFNVRGEPIVCTPEDAYLCFMRTEMDALVMEDCVLLKEEQPPLRDDVDWRSQYGLD